MDFFERNKQGIIALLIVAGVVAFVFYWRLGGDARSPGDYHVKKGNYRLEDGQFEKAVEEFNTALEKDSEHIGAHLGLGVTYMQMGRNDQSLEEFNRVLELDPEYAVAYADRGILLDRLGKYEQALADYRKALELDPQTAKGPGWIWRFLRNIDEKPPTIKDRADYIEAELKKPPEERLLKVPDIDAEQRMYKQ